MRQSCPLGMTHDDLNEVIPAGQWGKFMSYMYGQTIGVCNGTLYNHDTKQTIPSLCNDSPHGAVVYPWDVQRFLDGKAVID